LPLIDPVGPYEVLEITNSADWALLRKKCLRWHERSIPFDNVCSYFQNVHRCSHVLIETNYIDRDYRSEYAALYSQVAKRFGSTCIRLHFVDDKDFGGSFDDLNFHDRYLGYTVIRPIEVGKIGRTVLTPPATSVDAKYRLATCCAGTFGPHIAQFEQQVRGCVFYEQDSMVMTCAETSLFVATRIMRKRFNAPLYLPYDIRQKAALSRAALPSIGLVIEQMEGALSGLGYQPSVHRFNVRHQGALHIIGPYIRSGIPVILTFPEHAMTGIGLVEHKKIDTPRMESYREGCFISSVAWIAGVVVHDDALGPYRIVADTLDDVAALGSTQPLKHLLAVVRHEKDVIPRTIQWQAVRQHGSKTVHRRKQLDNVIVPLEKKVYLTAEDVRSHARFQLLNEVILKQFVNVAVSGNKEAKKVFESLKGTRPPLVYDARLRLAVSYKDDVGRDPLIPRKWKDELVAARMSRYVWHVEFRECIKDKREWAIGATVGEMIFDPTANRFSQLSYLAIRLPGILFLRQCDDEKVRVLRP
jgi:hypothetical protein